MATLAGVSLILLIVLFAYSARRPMTGNATMNLFPAKVIAEEGRHFFRWNESAPVVYANFHPPLYVNVLAAAFLIGGVSDLSARVANLLLVLAVMGLMIAVAVRISGDRARGMKTGLLAVALYAVNPAVLQSILTTDPDGTLLNLAIILTVYLLVSDFAGKPSWHVVTVGFGFALSLWSKETTPVFLAGLVLVHAWVSGGKHITVPRLFLAVGLGAVLFWGTYVAYCWTTGLSPFYMVQYALGLIHGEKRIVDLLKGLLYEIKIDFVWLNLFLVGAAFLASEMWGRWRSGREAWRTWSIVEIVGIGIYAIYFIIIISKGAIVPRYKIPALSFLSLIVARWVVRSWDGEAVEMGGRGHSSG
ncbi:MAG: ArnT family glycosyltransferase, partial [Nitrospinota bacterium]